MDDSRRGPGTTVKTNISDGLVISDGRAETVGNSLMSERLGWPSDIRLSPTARITAVGDKAI
jgi:hypothetical protein